MEIAIWIIAIIEVIRMIQTTIQLIVVGRNNANQQMKRATDALIKSFQKTDEEFIRNALKEMEKNEQK